MNSDDPVFRAMIKKSSLAELRPIAEKCPALFSRIKHEFRDNKCDCEGCATLHPSEYDSDNDDPTCHAPLFSGNGPWPSKCHRCYAELCRTCAIFCGDCSYAICRECDGCDKCETYSCPLCIYKRQCTDCGSTYCFKEDCHEELQQCQFCPRFSCETCRWYEGSWRCQGKDGCCTQMCCNPCFRKDNQTFEKCERCHALFCEGCYIEHQEENSCPTNN